MLPHFAFVYNRPTNGLRFALAKVQCVKRRIMTGKPITLGLKEGDFVWLFDPSKKKGSFAQTTTSMEGTTSHRNPTFLMLSSEYKLPHEPRL